MNRPWLALVESNTTGSGRQFCVAARARGLRPVVLAAQPQRYPYLDEDGLDRLVLDTGEPGAVLDACRRLAHRDGLAGVTSSSEYFAATAAEVATKLGLPGPDPLALARCRHKDRQRAVLAEAGVPVPAYRPVADAAAAAGAAEAIGYPVVVKPTTGSGSVGVRLCPDAAAVRAHAAGLLAGAVDERGRPVPRLVLVERYLTGPEFSVETFDRTVVAVTRKYLGPEPYFVETGHDVPAQVPPGDAAALADLALAALRALGLGRGAAHTELRMTPNGPVVVEVNPRLGGGMIPALVRLATGADLVDAVIAGAAGESPEPVARRLGYASIRFVLLDRPGTVTGLGGLDEARTLPGVELVALTVAPGAVLARTHSFRDRVGYAVAVGPDPTTAATRAQHAAASLRVQIETTGENT